MNFIQNPDMEEMVEEIHVEIIHWAPYRRRRASRAYVAVGPERRKAAVDVWGVPPDRDDVLFKMNAGEFGWL